MITTIHRVGKTRSSPRAAIEARQRGPLWVVLGGAGVVKRAKAIMRPSRVFRRAIYWDYHMHLGGVGDAGMMVLFTYVAAELGIKPDRATGRLAGARAVMRGFLP
jgi:hypothetical protein